MNPCRRSVDDEVDEVWVVVGTEFPVGKDAGGILTREDADGL